MVTFYMANLIVDKIIIAFLRHKKKKTTTVLFFLVILSTLTEQFTARSEECEKQRLWNLVTD